MKLILRLTVFAGIILSCQSLFSQTTVTYTQQTGNYYSTWTTGTAGAFNQGANQVGMYANGGGTKQVVSWRKFRTDASGSSTGDRALQVGDQFVVTLSATRAFGKIGFALLASPGTGSWANRESNYAISFNLDGPAYAGAGIWGNWYARFNGGSTSAGSANVAGQQTTYKNFTFTLTLTAPDRMNATWTDGTTTSTLNDILLNTSNPITDYSIFLEDDWDGGAARNIFWGLGAVGNQHTVTNQGALNHGQSNGSYTIGGVMFNGLNANSASSNTLNNTFNKSGTGNVTLNAANTYTGQTQIDNGELWIGSGGSISASSGIFVGNGGQLGNVTKLWLSNATGGTTFSNNFTINNGNLTTREIGGLNTSGNHTFSGAITNNATTGGLRINALNAGGTTTISGVVSGGGAVSTSGSGIVVFSGASQNTYTNTFTAGATTTVFNKSADTRAIGTGNVTINTGVTLRTDANNQLGTGTPSLITINGNGVFNLNSTNQKVALASASTTASVTLGSGILNIDNTGTDTYAGTISGTGGITKTNTGVEILTNSALAFTGNTTVTGGELRLNPSANATFASQVVLNGGTLGTTGISASRTWTSSSTLNVTANSTIALASATAHTITFAASNAVSWTAGTTVTITGWSGSYNGTTGTGGKIFFGSNSSGLTAQQLSQIVFNNGTNNFSATILSTGELVPSSNIIIPWINTGAATDWYTAGNWSPSTASNVWTTSNIAQFNNAGTATTSGINMGTAPLSIGAIDVTSNRTRVLTIGNSVTTAGTLTLNGAVVRATSNTILSNNSSSLFTVQDNETGTGKIMNVALGNSTDNIVNISSSGGITISSIIEGANRNLTKSGSGTGVFTLSGANTYSGTTTINSGTLACGAVSTLPAASAVVLANTSGTTLNLGGFNQSVASISGGGSNGGNITLGSATLTANQSGNTTFAGIISGTGGLTKSNSGTLILSGANTYSGTTTVSGGILRLGASGVIADGSAISLGGGTLSSGASAGFSETMGTLALTSSSTIALGTGNHTLTFSNSSAVSWTGSTTLTITGWSGSAGSSGTAGKIFFGNSSSTLTSSQLAQITFSGYSSGGALLSTGELVPLLAVPSITTTTAASSITATTASSGGQGITGSALSAKGLVYSTAAVSTNPTLSNSVLTDGTTTTANFTGNLSGLSPQTQYYVRAYATNASGTGYGPAINFRTLSNPPSVQASSLGASASASGQLTVSWTGATFPASGATQAGYALIYSTSTPSLSSASGSAPAAGVGTLVTITPTNLPSTPALSSIITGLTPGTTYNFLLVPFTWDGTNAATYNYLTTSAPTASAIAVGNPSITTTTAISSVTAGSASSGGSGISAGSGNISAKGVVWNTAASPTTANSATNDGTGTASFSSSLSSLTAQTLYYVRAYATNEVGTAYGNQLTFRTLSNEPTAAATSFTATANGSAQIDLGWTAATFPGSGATANGYIILRRSDASNPTTTNVTDGVAPASLTLPSGTSLVTTITSGASTSFNNTGLSASTQYNYIIIPYTWDGSNTETYNYLLTSAPAANATTDAGFPAITTTTAVSDISNNSASSGGSTITTGGSAITSKGVAWNTTGTPTIADNITNDGSGTANFTSTLSGLNPQTVYYTRAYVTNSSGTAYANELNFRTLSEPASAQASGLTATVSGSNQLTLSWTSASFPSSGATQAGYALIYSEGTPALGSQNGTAPSAAIGTLVVVSPTTLPTNPATSTIISGLTPGNLYNFRLIPFTWDGTNSTTYHYLTAGAATTTGIPVSQASVSTVSISAITSTSASSGGSTINNGGGDISAKGIVWHTSASPTLANNFTNDGTGTGDYSSSLTSLSPQTRYFVRAYATNEVGPAYGNELNFYTFSNPPLVQASGLTATTASESSINLSWTAASFPGSGASVTGYVLLRATSPNTPSLANTDGAAPTAGTNTTIVSASISGASTSAASTGLAALTTYNYLLVPFTWDGTNAGTYRYLTASAPTASATTFSALPAAQPTALVFSAVTVNTITTSWTAATGSPSGYIVLRSTGSLPNTDPVSGTTYTAGATLGNATVVFVGSAVTTGAQTGLIDGTTYFYEVFSYNGSGSSINYRTASPLSGSQATNPVSAPLAAAATAVNSSSFTANWNAVSAALNYRLDVGTTPCFVNYGSSSTQDEGFSAGTTAPSGWTFTTIGSTYTSAGNFGLASPSIQMDATGDRILTNPLSGSVATELSFWLKGNGTNTLSALLVEGTTDGTNWVTIENITNSIPTTGTTKTYNASSTPSLPCSMIQFRFTYTMNAGNLAFDDVSITSASATSAFVSGYNDLTVNGTSQSVTGLNSNTAYYYRVRAVGSNSTSSNSNIIMATTLIDVSNADFRSVASGSWNTNATWEFYNGVSWVAATQAPAAGNNVTIQSGHTVTLDANRTLNAGKTMTITGTLDAGSNSISGAGSVAMNATATLITSSSAGLAGAIQVSAPAGCTFTAGATIRFSGTNVNTGFAGFSGFSSTSFYNITWTGTTALTLDKTVRIQTLDFTNSGLIYLGNFDMFISNSGVINGAPFSSSKMIVTDGTGTLNRFITTGVWTSFTWPIGEVSGTAEYSPVTIGSSSGNAASTAYIGFRVTDAVDPNNGLASNYITRYWTYNTANLTAGTTWGSATFGYTASDIVGNQSSFKANAFNTGTLLWTEFASSSAASNVLTFTSGASTTSILTGNTITARQDPPIYYRSNASGDWTSLSTWQISTDPAFLSPTGVAAILIPTTSNSAGITIASGHTVGITTAVTADDITVSDGGILSVTSNGLTIANGSATTDLNINAGGTLQFSSSASNSLVINTGAAVVVNGLLKNNGANGSPDISNSGSITVASGGVYEHGRNAGAIPTCTWSAGSTCLITGTTLNAPTGLAQTFHHFTVNTTLGNHVNCSGALQTINGKFKLTTNHASFAWRLSSTTAYTLTVGDSLIIRNGILDMASGTITGTATINANGHVNILGAGSILIKTGSSSAVFNANNHFTQNEGTIDFAAASSNTTFNFFGDITLNGTVQRSSSGSHSVNFLKASGQQDFAFGGTQGSGALTWNIGNGTTTNTVRLTSSTWSLGSSAHQINVNGNATFNMQTGVISGANTGFTVLSGATLLIGHPQGITMSGTAEGNVQTDGARNFNGSAHYRYTGSSNQVTGSGLPSPITASLTMLNTGASGNNTLTLTNTNTTVSTFNLNSGLFAAGSGQQINISSGGSVNFTSGDFATGAAAGTIHFNGSGTWTGSGNPYVVSTSGGVNFGTGNISIQSGGAFVINAGGFVNTNAPSYSSGSTLQYNVNGDYGRGFEWSSTSGKGYPHHVLLSNNTTLNPASSPSAPNAAVPMRCGGNLSISSGSNIYMDFGGNNMTEDLVVLGNLNLSGNLSGSGANGSDIFLAGNWSNNGTGNNFFPNNRAVFFNGTSNQNIGGSNTGSNPFPFLFIDNPAGITLTAPQTVSTQLTLTNGSVILGAHSLTMNTGASITGISTSRYIVTNSTGQLIQRVSSSNVLFPIGPSASIYAPVTLNQAGTAENIGVLCETAPPFDQTLINDSRAVNVQWYLNESVADANSLFTSFQWPLSSEAASFNRSIGVFHGSWNGTAWDLRGSSSTTGSNPYTSSSSTNYTGNLSNRLFTIGNLRAYRNCNTTAQNGTWGNVSTWAFGLPESGDNVCLQHAVSVLSSDSDPAPVLGLDVQSGGSLSLASGRTLTFLSGGNLNNSSGSSKNLGAGNITANAALSITGSHPFTIGNLIINEATSLVQAPTISGSLQINANAYLTDASPVYSSNAGLIYNTGGSYTPGLEWNANALTPGSGAPGGLTIQGNTSIQMPNIPLAVAGNINLSSGALTLNSNVDNNLSLTGNWSRSAGFTFAPNSRAVFFNGSNALQTIEVIGGGTETFSYLYNNKTSGNLQLASGTNVTVSASVGNVLGLIATSSLDLNGQSLTLNGAGGSILANGGTCNIIGGANSSLNILNATKSVNAQNSGTLSTGANVRIALSTGMDFGNNLSTINGTLQIALGGFVSNNPPNYASGSTLRYFTGSSYGRGLEWSATSGPGYPWHVTIDQNGTVTSLDLSNGGSALRQIAGNLNINNGGVLTMQSMTDALNVRGNVTVANGGNLTLGSALGGDLDIGGNFTLQASSTFNQNSREIEMNGNGNIQVLSGLTTPGFLAINNAGGSVQLSEAITIQNRLRLTDGTLNLNGFALNLAANSSIRRQSSGASLSAEPTVGAGNTYDLRYDASMTSGPEFLSDGSALRDLTVSGSGSTLSLSASRTVNRDINLLSGAGINVNGFTLVHSGNNVSAPTGTIFVNGNSEISNSAGLSIGGFSISGSPNQPTFFTKTISNSAGTGTLNFASNITLSIGDGKFDFGLSGGNSITTVSGVLQIAGGGSVFPNSCIYAVGSTLRFYNNFDYQVDAGDNTWRSGAINSGLPGIPWNVEIRDANTDLYLNQERSVRNNLSITDGKLRLIYSGSNTFNVGGNWTRTGVTSAFVNTNNKKVVFNRSIAGDQVITTGNGVNTETFYDIEITNTGGGDVSIGNNVNLVIQNSMTLTSGKMKLGTGSTFQLGIPGNNGTIVGAGANRYIVTWTGSNSIPLKLFTNTNGAYQFPVGDNTSYTPFTIDIVSGANSGSFITCSTTPAAHPSLGTTSNYLNRYWTLEQTGLNSGFTYNVNFSYTDADVVGSETLLFPFKWTPGIGNGTGWIGCGGSSASYTVGTGTTDINTNTMQWQGITSFSDFTGNGGGTPLPISLLSFEATPQDGKVVLDWVTLSETNNAFFTVERSSDLSEIHTLARIEGAGNHNGKLSYSAIDHHPLLGTSYYRLRQTDFSGESTYTQWVALQMLDMANAQLMLYPNPVQNGMLFVETSGFDEHENIRIEFCDLSGKNLLLSNMSPGSASTRTTIDLADLQSGVYLLHIQYKGHKEIRKIVIQ
ncbi:MAG: autotransporter-associated beta strand repeat-containing protein [Bacteroidota bacterium]